jgi:4-hydroxy-4-methyl-2-oxoglutarate aldolase
MTQTTHDTNLTLVREKLYTAVIGDILDTLGRTHQFLPPRLSPLIPTARIAGRAMPVVVNDVYGPQVKPFGLLTEALDQLEKDEVYISTAISQPVAQWGEILSATAQQRGAVGAVVNGYYRDTRQILERQFPVWGFGSYGADSSIRSAVSNFRAPIVIGAVSVHPGDLIVADIDGVLVVPRDVEDDVIGIALEKVATENTVCREIDNGSTATAAFEKHGVL